MIDQHLPRSVELQTPARRVLDMSQRAAANLRWGERFAATAEVEVTPAGLLAVGGLVGMILLGSAVIVHAAKRGRGAHRSSRDADAPTRLRPLLPKSDAE